MSSHMASRWSTPGSLTSRGRSCSRVTSPQPCGRSRSRTIALRARRPSRRSTTRSSGGVRKWVLLGGSSRCPILRSSSTGGPHRDHLRDAGAAAAGDGVANDKSVEDWSPNGLVGSNPTGSALYHNDLRLRSPVRHQSQTGHVPEVLDAERPKLRAPHDCGRRGSSGANPLEHR